MSAALRSVLRTLVQSPGYTIVAVLTLALGIGATTAVFSIVNGVVLQPLNYAVADELVAVRVVQPAMGPSYPTTPLNARFYVEWRGCPALASLALLDCYPGETTLTGAGAPERLRSARVSANFFETLGIHAHVGRVFAAGDDEAGAARIALISERLWRQRFEGDSAVLGRAITLDHEPHVIVGVLPTDFRVPSPSLFGFGRRASSSSDIFTPKVLSEQERGIVAGQFNYEAVGRLAPGVTVADAQAQLDVVAARLAQLAGDGIELRSMVVPLHEAVVGRASRGLSLLLGAVGAVLLIACLNLAILALVRAERRSHEAAVRAALGASRGQLLRQALFESLVLLLGGGVIGVLCAYFGLEALLQLVPAELPRVDEVRLDLQVLGFATGLTFVVGLICGLLPAWKTTRVQPGDVLRGGSGRTTTGSAADLRLRQALIAVEVGLGAMLLVVTTLFASSFARVMRAHPGFEAPSVITADIAIPMAKYADGAQRVAFHERLLERVRAIPGVASCAISTGLPLQGEFWVDGVWTDDPAAPAAEHPSANIRFISADFFGVMGIPLRAGRTFEEGDRNRSVTVISEKLAERLWPGRDPIGRRLNHHGRNDVEVIGVVGDVRARADSVPVSMLYRPYWVWPPPRAMLVARAFGAPQSIAGSIRTAIRDVDAEVPVPAMRTLEDLRDESVAERRFQTQLATAFGASALLLAVVGIYGIVAYAATRRTRELGIRAAFGARPVDLHAMVLRQGMKPVAIGLAAGLTGALATGRFLAALLYETSATDPLIVGGVAFALIAVALAAAWLPAHRAARVDPSVALRAE